MTEIERPKVGVGVIVLHKGKVLLGKRKNSHGSNTWNFPGGHLEFNEEIIECARREVLEETGMEIINPQISQFTNDIFKEEKKHYITIFVICGSKNNDPKIMEPDKCEEWNWFDWDNLPEPLFLPIQNLLKQGFVLNK